MDYGTNVYNDLSVTFLFPSKKQGSSPHGGEAWRGRVSRVFNRAEIRDKRRELRKNMTPAEVLLWSELKGKYLNGYKFRRQYSVGPYVIDFYCPKLRLAIEIDGDAHFESDTAVARDRRRQRFIEAYGITFVRFTTHDVCSNLTGVIEGLLKYLS